MALQGYDAARLNLPPEIRFLMVQIIIIRKNRDILKSMDRNLGNA